tara:strand:- start:2135 stop:4045 length:1911 start_codon:yes stop_codon:yes gene_type:complete
MFLAACNACSEAFMDDPVPFSPAKETLQSDEDTIAGPGVDVGPSPSDVYPFPGNSCVQCQWYYCPPLNSVWQKQICIDHCVDPPAVLHEGECKEYLQCDPTQYLIESVECITEEGYPGTQSKVCNKGQIQYTECVTECTEEMCNSIDDDCDGETDEGQLNLCGACGLEPIEICDGVDNNCNGTTDEDLFQPCYTACGTGVEFCSSGNWIGCTAPPAMVEICDGLDNDCDGSVDEGLTCECMIQDVGVLFPCMEAPLLCGQGFKTCECVDGDCTTITTTECFAFCYYFPDPDATCDPLIGMPLEDELCNNFDDNCNQLIDEDLYASCYSGPQGTVNQGICIPGQVVCESGTWGGVDNGTFTPGMCEGEITPQEEICNGIDDDCDGVTDTGEELQDTDIMFIVDWSGSMDNEISAVLAALNSFAQQYSDDSVIQWGLIIGPKVPDQYYGNHNYLEMISNLSSFSDFMSSFSGLNGTPMSGQYEMLYDAIYLSIWNIATILPYGMGDIMWATGVGTAIDESVPPLEDFIVNWRPNAKRVVIVFSDEKGQSYMLPDPVPGSWNSNDTITEELLTDVVASTPDLKVYTFSPHGVKEVWNSQGGWEPIAKASGGKWYPLSTSIAEMYNYLMEIIDDNACSTE